MPVSSPPPSDGSSHRPAIETKTRQAWMRTLALAPARAVIEALQETQDRCGVSFPSTTALRPPEVGMAMVQARAGGSGQRFNLGEMTMTRCAVRLDTQPPVIGFSHIAGRNTRHAEAAALCDALLQTDDWSQAITEGVIVPLAEAQRHLANTVAQRAAATRVDFFTMVRGES